MRPDRIIPDTSGTTYSPTLCTTESMKLTSRQKEFRNNLNQAVNKLTGQALELEELNFKISLIEEANKKQNSRDDLMRRWVHEKINFEQEIWTIDSVLGKLTSPKDRFPLWIEIHQIDQRLIELKSSTRFRRFSELQNKEGGFPPFKICKLP